MSANDSNGIAEATMTPASALTTVSHNNIEIDSSSSAMDLSDNSTVYNTTTTTTTSTTTSININERREMERTSFLTSDSKKSEVTRQKIVDIIDHQFDLEILLRNAEGAAIAQELSKAERMLEDLRHAILSERQGSAFGSSTVSRTFGNANTSQNSYHSSRPGSRRNNAYYGRDTRQPEALYAVRADGQFVRLGCPKCDRYDFGSIQGLINHMRLSHKLIFKNTEEGVRYCGIVVPSSEVPADHPCRTKIVFSSLGASQGQDFPKPTIKTYDEDVDLESEDGNARNGSNRPTQTRKNSITSTHSISNAGSEDESDTSGMASAGESGNGIGARRRSSLALRPQKGTDSDANVDSDSDGSDGNEKSARGVLRPPHGGKGPMRKYGSLTQGPPASNAGIGRPGMTSRMTIGNYIPPDSLISSAASSRATSPSLHPLMNESDISEPPTPLSLYPPPSVSTPQISQQTATTIPIVASIPIQQQVQTPSQPQTQPTIISFGASAVQDGVPAPLDTVGSRFYVKRRIVVGNVSKFLPEEKRDVRLKKFSYKWMIYVDGTPKPEEITAYVSKVEFHLHESYKPNHIITVSEPPFHLSRFAWGETQIKVRMFFHDTRNKPVDIFHSLALDPTHCGRQVHGREKYVDLELDRNTVFKLPVAPHSRSKGGNKSKSRNNLILNSAAEVAMAAGAEEDEQELQYTLAHTAQSSSSINGAANGGLTIGDAGNAGARSGVDTLRAASFDNGPAMRTKAKATNLLYCKACGSLWKQHRDGALGVAGSISEHVLLNEDNGQRITNCPHHSKFFAVKTFEKDDPMLQSVLVGRSKNKFALDMLMNCGIVDQDGHPLTTQERILMEMNQTDSAMDLDIGDSEVPTPTSNPKTQQLIEAFKNIDVYKGRRTEIDWVLSVMDELKHKTLFLDGGVGGGSGGSRGGLRDRDQEQEQLLNTPGLTKVPDSMSQRAVVGGLLVQATKAFLNKLVTKAISIHRTETEEEKGPESIMMELDALDEPEESSPGGEKIKVSEKLLAPYHIYRALQSNPEEMDFLTNQYEDMDGIGEMIVGP